MTIAERLLQLRQEKGLTLRELAADVGITAAALSAYEKGKKEPSLGFAIRLAKYYGKTLDNLCGVEDVTKPQSYADILLFILRTNRSLGEKLSREHGFVVSRGKINNGERSLSCAFEMRDSKHVRFAMDIDSADVAEFFDTYVKLSELAESGAIPESIFLNWQSSVLAKEAQTPLMRMQTIEDRAEEAREIGV